MLLRTSVGRPPSSTPCSFATSYRNSQPAPISIPKYRRRMTNNAAAASAPVDACNAPSNAGAVASRPDGDAAVDTNRAPAPSPTVAGGSFVAPVAVLQVDTSTYHAQLQAKLAKLRELFKEFNPPPVEVFESPPRCVWQILAVNSHAGCVSCHSVPSCSMHRSHLTPSRALHLVCPFTPQSSTHSYYIAIDHRHYTATTACAKTPRC